MIRPIAPIIVFLIVSGLFLPSAPMATAGENVVLIVDRVGVNESVPHPADILSVILDTDPLNPRLRISFLSLDTSPQGLFTGKTMAALPQSLPLSITASNHGENRVLFQGTMNQVSGRFQVNLTDNKTVQHPSDDPDAIWLDIDPALLAAGPVTFEIKTVASEKVTASYPADKVYAANCALVLHGNQGLGYSDVFHGRSDDEAGSGFDEALEVHQATGIPGNFHLSGTLQTSAEWAARSGDPVDFNAWLAAGVTSGWAGIVTSAYAQHIMPFVNDDMNNWAVSIESAMINTRYGYTPRVAWVPERVWLDPSIYPNQGVNDWIGDNFLGHGVWGVVLDDDVHITGHDNHQIHFATNGLRLIPRDRNFTGNIIGGNGQAALDILTGLAGSGVGEFRIAVLAEDWEAISEMGGWATITPNAVETYDWFINKCATESAWLSTWKLADAITNTNFNGDTFDPTPGTYNEIGGFDGYGGGNNSWYPHWAGWVPSVTGGDGSGSCSGSGSCKNYGTIWNDAFNALMAAPNNNISQAGWYVMMTNLYETAWHDGMGGPISGWEHNYSAHIKNALIYAEAAHWANGEYATTTAAYFSDIDGDGFDEVIMHSDKLFAVFEGVGGRCVNLFVNDGSGADTAIGSDNAYWSGTTGDYNDDNHVGAFSDVGPNYQHDFYDLSIVQGSGTTVTLLATHNEVSKEISLTEGDAFLDAVYRVGASNHWIKMGCSPSLVDLVWNAEMDRVWALDTAYMGRHNPNTGMTVAWVLGTAGAAHQGEFSGTIMRGDEVVADGTFALRLYAGHTSAPDGSGEVAEVRAVANTLVDDLGPLALSADYFPTTQRLILSFDQPADPASLSATLIGLDEDADGIPELNLGLGTTVLEVTPSVVLTLQLDTADALAFEALNPAQLVLNLATGAVDDAGGVSNATQIAPDAPPVSVHAAGLVSIDGRFDAGEWNFESLPDSSDSAWGTGNEIDQLVMGWDHDNLYLGIDGIVTSNSWLLYIDVDPGTANGETDLSAIDAWERGAVFTAPGFAADFQYGCYQHQSGFDGGSFWTITSAITAVDATASITHAHDASHSYGDAGGSELAIPWSVLYPGVTGGVVPPGASISVVVSICWDPEPDGVLGGDSAPNNTAAVLPIIDNVWTVTIDANNDGEPDPWDSVAVNDFPRRLAVEAWPNPFNPATTIRFELPTGDPVQTKVEIVNLRGERVVELVNEVLSSGRHQTVWQGVDRSGRVVSAGTYYCVVKSGGHQSVRPLTLVK